MITFTGIDEFTDLAAAEQFAYEKQCELAVLWTDNPEDRPRYPSWEFIKKAVDRLGGKLAIHICGHSARSKALNWNDVPEVLRKAGRLQVNGALRPEELMRFLSIYDRKMIITQHTAANAELLMVWGDKRHSLLVDGSGGRGILPDKWQAPNTSKFVGFAGGLGPDTLGVQMKKLIPLMHHGSWIDMESSLRDGQDHFSLERAAACLHIFQQSLLTYGTLQ